MQKKKPSKAENLIRVCEIQNEITEILLDKFQTVNNIRNNKELVKSKKNKIKK